MWVVVEMVKDEKRGERMKVHVYDEEKEELITMEEKGSAVKGRGVVLVMVNEMKKKEESRVFHEEEDE